MNEREEDKEGGRESCNWTTLSTTVSDSSSGTHRISTLVSVMEEGVAVLWLCQNKTNQRGQNT